jgi:quercetin dioxygenase-like cupin family protein
MKITRLSDYVRGWIVGDFEPSILRTKDFEVGLLTHKKGEEWPKHIHELATEYNVLVQGKMRVNGQYIYEGEVFVIEKGEAAKPEFFEDCLVLVIKVPSVIGDKHEVV